ncbi:hypothetical protein AAVH_23970 [Aphelenchoides avenae]|nr:hypothetical protein AAVH_23970 [Aphelenchus avenae]
MHNDFRALQRTSGPRLGSYGGFPPSEAIVPFVRRAMTTKKALRYAEVHGLPVVLAPTVAPEAKPDRQDVQGQTVAQEILELQVYREILGVRRPQCVRQSCDLLVHRVRGVRQEHRVRWDRQVTPGSRELQAGLEEFHSQASQGRQDRKDREENPECRGRRVLLESLLSLNQSCLDHQVQQAMPDLLDRQDRPVSQAHQDFQDHPDQQARLVLLEHQAMMESQDHPVALDPQSALRSR